MAVGEFANILFTVHMAAASVSGIAALAIDKGESDQLAQAIANVANLYDLPAVSAEAIAWGNLAVVAFQIYGSRIIVARATAQAAKATSRAAAPGQAPATKIDDAPKAQPAREPPGRTVNMGGLEIEVMPPAGGATPPPPKAN